MLPKPLRGLLIIAIFFGSYVLSWVLLLLASFGLLGGAANLLALIVALVVAYRVWPKTQTWPQSVIGWTLMGAMLMGVTGFIGGFFGPIIFAPEANQGPLLGIFYNRAFRLYAGRGDWFADRAKTTTDLSFKRSFNGSH